jgi:hypothetical protein
MMTSHMVATLWGEASKTSERGGSIFEADRVTLDNQLGRPGPGTVIGLTPKTVPIEGFYARRRMIDIA